MKNKSKEQQKIDAVLEKRKQWLLIHEPVCIFCGRLVVYLNHIDADLAHKVRRSWASCYHTRYIIQTMPLNTGLAHRACHEIFDNNLEQARYLPRFNKILADIKQIDIDYWRVINNSLINIKAN